MWLLDASMDVHLSTVLAGFNISSDAAGKRGCKALSNGDMVGAGFRRLLTRDQLFGESAFPCPKDISAIRSRARHTPPPSTPAGCKSGWSPTIKKIHLWNHDVHHAEWRRKWPRWQSCVGTPVEFKRRVVERMKTCENIHALAREFKIERTLAVNPLTVRLHHLTQATHNRAVEKLLADLNPTQTVFPGPKPILVFKLGSA
jgi:hypothetical protein